MTLATASIDAITARVSRIDSEIDTNAANITLATASIDLSVANYFTLTLSGSTNINVTNPRAGVTATLVINTSTGASASFSNNVNIQPDTSNLASKSDEELEKIARQEVADMLG